MSSIDHEDITDILQYNISFVDQVKKLKEKNPDIVLDDLVRCADGITKVSKRIVDKKIVGGAKVNDPKKVSIISAIIIGASVLIGACMLISNSRMNESVSTAIRLSERIAILEEKVGFLEDHDLLLEKRKDDAYNKIIGGE